MTREQELELRVAELEAIAQVRLEVLQTLQGALNERNKTSDLFSERSLIYRAGMQIGQYTQRDPEPNDLVLDAELEMHGWVPGQYDQLCWDCRASHMAAKRSTRCRKCAATAFFKK